MHTPARHGRPARRLAAALLLAVAWCTLSVAVPATPAGAATLSNAAWTTTKTSTGATGAAYTFSSTTATAGSLSSVTMAVPAGTTGPPTLGTVSPTTIAGGTVSLAGTTLTYAFTATTVGANVAISIQVTGLTNSTTAGSYTSVITTKNGLTSVDTGTSGPVILTAGALTSLGWTASSTTVGAAGVSYTFTAKTATAALAITSITMTVPPGTGLSSATLGTVSPSGLLGGSISTSGTTITYSGVSLLALAGTTISIQINGVTNTSIAGIYTSEIATHGLLTANIDSGVTPSVTISGPLSGTTPTTLGWAATLSGSTTLHAVDGTAGDQQLGVDDETATGNGWHITVSATTFTSGTKTLPNSGTFVFTGSTSSVTATTGPTITCVTSCTPPVNTTTYPVAITTAASSPTASTVVDTAVKSGMGPSVIGGSTATNPIGWWVNVLPNARAGSYTSTVIVSVVSGP